MTEIGLWKCVCQGRGDNSFPDIEFRMGGPLAQHWFKITSNEYLSDEMQVWCLVLLRPTPEVKGRRDRWILGDLFLRAYDVIHDYENLKVGLVGNALTAHTEEV